MTAQLEEIKRLAEKMYEESDDPGPSPAQVDELATHCLRLVAALEKCREQRDTEIMAYLGSNIPLENYNEEYERILTKILEGKDE